MNDRIYEAIDNSQCMIEKILKIKKQQYVEYWMNKKLVQDEVVKNDKQAAEKKF